MTSEEEEMPRFVTGGYGRHRRQWVKQLLKIFFIMSSFLTFFLCRIWQASQSILTDYFAQKTEISGLIFSAECTIGIV